MSGIPGSRVGGIGPIGPIGRYSIRRYELRDGRKVLTERPEHAACRQRTPEEAAGHRAAVARRNRIATDAALAALRAKLAGPPPSAVTAINQAFRDLDRRLAATARNLSAQIAQNAHHRTCTDPTCFCDWSQP